MRKVTWIRLGIATALATIGGVGAIAAGCSGDDNTVTTPPGGGDSGTHGDTGVGSDTGTGSDGGLQDANKPDVVAAKHAKLVLVHGAPGVYPFRVCFATGTKADGSDATVAAFSALPDAKSAPLPFAGVFPGTGGAFPDITDLSGTAITPFLLRADRIAAYDSTMGANEPDCTKFIGTDGKGANADPNLKLPPEDYYPLPTIPAQTFLDNNTYLLSLVGCMPDPNDAGFGFNTALCGSTWTAATGNVAVGIGQLDTTTMVDGGIGVQFAHRSAPVEGLPGMADTTALGQPGVNPVHDPASNGVIPALNWVTMMDGGPEAGTVVSSQLAAVSSTPVKYSKSDVSPAQAFAFNGTMPSDPSLMFGVGMVKADGGVPTFAPWPFGPATPGGNPAPNTGDYYALGLPTIQLLSGPVMDGGFTAGETYTFVLLGDPTKTIGAIVQADGGGVTSTCAETPNNPDAGCNPLYEMHFVAFPNHLSVPKLQ
jgi:hypothetical protein